MQPIAGGGPKARRGRPKVWDLVFCGMWLFLSVVATGVVFLLDNWEGYYMTQFVSKNLLNRDTYARRVRDKFMDIYTVEDMEQFIGYTFVKFVSRKTGAKGRGKVKQKSMYISEDVVMLGVPRVKHLKVKKSKCRSATFLQVFFYDCYGEYDQAQEVMDTDVVDLSTEFSYRSTRNIFYQGTLAKYGGNGNMLFLNTSLEVSAKIMSVALEMGLAEFGTRAMFLEFAAYSRSSQQVIIVMMLFERSPAGGLLPSYRFYITSSPGVGDYVFVAVVGLYFLVCLVEFAWRMKKAYPYCTTFWNSYDAFLTYLSLYTLICGIGVIGDKGNIARMGANPNEFHDLADVSYNAQMYMGMKATLVFFMYIKVIRHMRCTFQLLAIKESYNLVSPDLVSYACIFYVILIGYGLLTKLLFGDYVLRYHSVGRAMASVFRALVGDFDVEEIARVQPYLASLFLLLFIITIVLILSRVFSALVINAHFDIRKDAMFTIPSAVHKLSKLENIFSKLRGRPRLDCWRGVLKKSGFPIDAIKEIIERNGVKPCDAINLTKLQTILETETLNYKVDIEKHKIRRSLDEAFYKMLFLNAGIAELSVNTHMLCLQVNNVLKLKAVAGDDEELEEEIGTAKIGAVKSKRFGSDPNQKADDEDDVKTQLPCGPSCFLVGQAAVQLDRDRERAPRTGGRFTAASERAEAVQGLSYPAEGVPPSPTYPRTNLPIGGHTQGHVIYKTIRLSDVPKGRYSKKKKPWMMARNPDKKREPIDDNYAHLPMDIED